LAATWRCGPAAAERANGLSRKGDHPGGANSHGARELPHACSPETYFQCFAATRASGHPASCSPRLCGGFSTRFAGRAVGLFEGSRSVKTHVTAVGTHRCHDWQSTSKGNVPVFHLRKVIHGVVDALVRLVADLTLLLRATGRESVSKLSTSVL
jgi:hypothetical protein